MQIDDTLPISHSFIKLVMLLLSCRTLLGPLMVRNHRMVTRPVDLVSDDT